MFAEMSYFNPPIRPYRDSMGGYVRARLVPDFRVTVEQVHQMITSSLMLRQLTQMLRALPEPPEADDVRREMKSTRLPFVTPCGVFRRRRSDEVVELSGLLVLDIDHLDSLEEACRVRDELFSDECLRALLAFVSPGGLGVKLLVPWVTEAPFRAIGRLNLSEFVNHGWQPTAFNLHTVSEQTLYGMDYLNTVAQLGCVRSLTKKQLECDFTGKDVSRACFLGYDPGAKYRPYRATDNR